MGPIAEGSRGRNKAEARLQTSCWAGRDSLGLEKGLGPESMVEKDGVTAGVSEGASPVGMQGPWARGRMGSSIEADHLHKGTYFYCTKFEC